jgi:hypothetical protein
VNYGLVAVVFISMSVQDVFYTASVVLLARAKDWRGALKGGIMDGLGDLTLPFCVVSTGVSWVRYGLSALTLAMLAALLLGSMAGSEVGFYIGRKLDRTIRPQPHQQELEKEHT